MKTQPSLSRSISALAHPAALLAAAVLLLNALVWQRLWPSWWTGKVGDFAWLVIAPLLAAVPLSLAPFLRRLSPRRFIAIVCLLVALAFALAKCVPALNSALLVLGAGLGLHLKLRLDPTDLLALPGALVAGWAWHHPPRWPRRPLQTAALALAALAVVADVAAPQDHGINCLTVIGSADYAVREIYQPSEMPSGGGTQKTFYRSDDAGLTWTLDSKADAGKITCAAFPKWPVVDPSDPNVQLYSVPGGGIYRSTDNGQNLRLEQAFKNVLDSLSDPSTGNLILAAGREGIWVKAHAGQWRQTLVLPQP